VTSTLAVREVKIAHFTTTSEHAGETIVLRMCGNADSEAHPALEQLLREIDLAAMRLHVKETVVSFQELYFMNSSCLSLLVRWIGALTAREEAARYRIKFLSNPKLSWQKRSLRALDALGQGVVTSE